MEPNKIRTRAQSGGVGFPPSVQASVQLIASLLRISAWIGDMDRGSWITKRWNVWIFVQYEEINELEKDFNLMCRNAQNYNEESSIIYEDSVTLQSVFSTARERVEKEAEAQAQGELFN